MIGAGLIGTESGATLAAAGHEVTVLDSSSGRSTVSTTRCPTSARRALAATRARFLGGISVTELTEDRDGQVTRCHLGGSLGADLVLAATGGRSCVPPGLDVGEADLPLVGGRRAPGSRPRAGARRR